MISDSKIWTRNKNDRKSFDSNKQNKTTIRPSASHSHSLDLIAQFKKQHFHQEKSPQFNNSIMKDLDVDRFTSDKLTMSHSSSFSHVQPINRHSSLQVTQQQHQQQHHSGGFLLGTFLKVWTRLKRPILPGVGAKSNQKLVHSQQLISNQINDGFEYIPSDQMDAISTPTKLVGKSKILKLCDEDFRQNHFQSQQLRKQHLLLLSDEENKMEKSTINNNTGSSGISCGSSQHIASQQLHNNVHDLTQLGQAHLALASSSASSTSSSNCSTATANSPPVESPNHCIEEVAEEPEEELVGDKKVAKGVARRISAPPQLNAAPNSAKLNDDGPHTIRLHNNQKKLRGRQKGLRNTLSEDVAEQLSDSLSGDDIYSTPNDSIVSLQNHGLRSMVKSHSTNNFSLSSMNNVSTREQQKPPPLPPRISTSNHITNGNNNKLLKSNSKGRFFISSSSSEDSSSISNHENLHNQTNNNNDLSVKIDPNSHQTQSNRRFPFNLGVHYHSISPPSSLIRTSTQSIVMSSQQQQNQALNQSNMINLANQDRSSLFLPFTQQQQPMVDQTAPMSPMDISSPTKKLTSFMQMGARKSQLMTSFHKKSPSLCDFQNKKVKNSQIFDNNCANQNSFQYKRNLLASQERKSLQTDSSSTQMGEKLMASARRNNIPNSISLYNCQLSDVRCDAVRDVVETNDGDNAEFKLAQMLLHMGSELNITDDDGQTALMYATLSDNFASVKCLVEAGANINATNSLGLNALDLLCSKEPTEARLKMLNFFLSNGADCDAMNDNDRSRLLDRLIRSHQASTPRNTKSGGKTKTDNKLPYIDFLLQNGAKLGSSTWHAAYGKHEILLRLLKKLCQDGYYLYKSSSIEAAVYRFEYALKRAVELDYQIATEFGSTQFDSLNTSQIQQACQQLKYQTYLGLSRCELKRKFYNRALEFAQLAILVDSTAYEAYYSKGHIQKNMGDLDGALNTINQSLRLVDKSIADAKTSLEKLYEQQEESMVIFEAIHNNFVELKQDKDDFVASRKEIESMVDYLCEAKRFILNLKDDILRQQQQQIVPEIQDPDQFVTQHELAT